MHFSGREDIEAPIAAVFGMLSEFERFERLAIRRGVEVTRSAGSVASPVGVTWDTVLRIRGKYREMQVVLEHYEPPHLMRFQATSKGVDAFTGIELLALSASRTRLIFDLKLTPKTLPARLFLQSLKLARARLKRQFELRLAELARDLEERHSRSSA
ncbi:MAG: SRPBCC family protein [Ruegeria sp.]|uniref:SRPBCC family protein n=1 Tax=Ruegeria sp. TaxID=1879320 RepID=UPI00349EF48F